MEITVERQECTVVIHINGLVDSITALQLEKEAKNLFDGTKTMIFEVSNMEYMSSAGLRVLVGAQQKLLEVAGEVRILHPSESVKEIFEVTGMYNVFSIED